MDPAAFLEDLEAKPAALRSLADRLEEADPWASFEVPRRIVLIGMGSSRYAARVAATRLRTAGIDAVAEYASLEAGSPGGPGTLAVGISASGGTAETLEALARHRAAGSVVAALTNVTGSPVTEVADRVVDMAAGVEAGGVACRSFQHTLAMLLSLEARSPVDRRPRSRDGSARPPPPRRICSRAAITGWTRRASCSPRARPSSRSRRPSGSPRPIKAR